MGRPASLIRLPQKCCFPFAHILVLFQLLHPLKDGGFGCPGNIHSVGMSDFLEGSCFEFPTYRFYFKSMSDVLHVDLQFLYCMEGFVAFVVPDVPIDLFFPALHGLHHVVFPGSRLGVKKEPAWMQLSMIIAYRLLGRVFFIWALFFPYNFSAHFILFRRSS